jgi:hypothetical protein
MSGHTRKFQSALDEVKDTLARLWLGFYEARAIEAEIQVSMQS